MKQQIVEFVDTHKIIAIVRKLDTDLLLPTAEAVYAGGIRLMEITFDPAGEFPEEKTAEQIALLNKHFDGRMLIGAGTVLSPHQVEIAAKAGAKYIISPNVDKSVIKRTRELGLVSMPGAMTPTEMQAAHVAGADFIKIFPSDTLGIGYIKAVLAPLSHIKALAVGGVNETNIKDYLAAGVKGVGIGSNIIKKKLIEAGKFDEITALAKLYTDQI